MRGKYHFISGNRSSLLISLVYRKGNTPRLFRAGLSLRAADLSSRFSPSRLAWLTSSALGRPSERLRRSYRCARRSARGPGFFSYQNRQLHRQLNREILLCSERRVITFRERNKYVLTSLVDNDYRVPLLHLTKYVHSLFPYRELFYFYFFRFFNENDWLSYIYENMISVKPFFSQSTLVLTLFRVLKPANLVYTVDATGIPKLYSSGSIFYSDSDDYFSFANNYEASRRLIRAFTGRKILLEKHLREWHCTRNQRRFIRYNSPRAKLLTKQVALANVVASSKLSQSSFKRCQKIYKLIRQANLVGKHYLYRRSRRAKVEERLPRLMQKVLQKQYTFAVRLSKLGSRLINQKFYTLDPYRFRLVSTLSLMLKRLAFYVRLSASRRLDISSCTRRRRSNFSGKLHNMIDPVISYRSRGESDLIAKVKKSKKRYGV